MGCALMNDLSNPQMDVLILAPFGKDAPLIGSVLGQSGIKACIVGNAREIVAAIPDKAGAAILTEEALDDGMVGELSRKLEAQPRWRLKRDCRGAAGRRARGCPVPVPHDQERRGG